MQTWASQADVLAQVCVEHWGPERVLAGKSNTRYISALYINSKYQHYMSTRLVGNTLGSRCVFAIDPSTLGCRVPAAPMAPTAPTVPTKIRLAPDSVDKPILSPI